MTMIEKIARAMAASDKMDCDEWGGLYQERARAALQAMLEPSEGMVEAGNDWVITEDGRKVFTAMIRAALEEK